MSKETVKEYNKQYRLTHKAEAKEYSRLYRINNLERVKKWNKDWHEKNRDKANARARKWYKSNPIKTKNFDLKKNYGIGLEQYNELLISQNGLCAICKNTNSSGRSLAVDHNHKTGQIRGLLCDRCNFALGHFQDSIEFLLRAITYLKNN